MSNIRKPVSKRTQNKMVKASAKPNAAQIIQKEVIEAQATPPARYNRQLKPENCELIIARVARGDTISMVARELGVDNGLIYQRAYNDPDGFGKRLREARAIGAHNQFDSMLAVAMDESRPIADRRLIVEVLEKFAKAHNRAVYGDKVQHDVRSLNITLNQDDIDLV